MNWVMAILETGVSIVAHETTPRYTYAIMQLLKYMANRDMRIACFNAPCFIGPAGCSCSAMFFSRSFFSATEAGGMRWRTPSVVIVVSMRLVRSGGEKRKAGGRSRG